MVADPWSATLAVVDALDVAGIPCAVGGSLAMAAVGYVRATQDGDVNVFVPMEDARRAFVALADAGLQVDVEGATLEAAARGDGRLYVDGIRVDLFFDSIRDRPLLTPEPLRPPHAATRSRAHRHPPARRRARGHTCPAVRPRPPKLAARQAVAGPLAATAGGAPEGAPLGTLGVPSSG